MKTTSRWVCAGAMAKSSGPLVGIVRLYYYCIGMIGNRRWCVSMIVVIEPPWGFFGWMLSDGFEEDAWFFCARVS